MKRTEIINALARIVDAKRYLEIGVRDVNENFAHIKVGEKISVDPDKNTKATFKVTSDEFFETYEGESFDLVFVDGLHTAEQSYKDVVNAMDFLSDGGVIVMHDCNPPTAWHTRSYKQYLSNRGPWNGDVYKGFIRLRSDLEGSAMFTVDSDYGCGVVIPNPGAHEGRFDDFTNRVQPIDWESYDYAAFNDHRNEILNLISTDKFKQLCKIS